jgi:hypothetical protein
MMVWQDMSHLNAKWGEAYLAGLGQADEDDSACDSSNNCDCYVIEGDVGPHIVDLQVQINDALVANGFRPIVLTGVFDKQTCGAVDAVIDELYLRLPPECAQSEWSLPPPCENSEPPRRANSDRTASDASKAAIYFGGGIAFFWLVSVLVKRRRR